MEGTHRDATSVKHENNLSATL